MKQVSLFHACLVIIPALALIGYELNAYYSAEAEVDQRHQQTEESPSARQEVRDPRYEALVVKLAESDEKLLALTARLERLTEQMAVAQQEIAESQANLSNQVAGERRQSLKREVPSVQSRFESPQGVSQRLDNSLVSAPDIVDAIAYNMHPSEEILSSECRSGLCKIYNSNSLSNVSSFSDDEFASNLATSLGGEVSVYFDQEDGQSVVYVEVPE